MSDVSIRHNTPLLAHILLLTGVGVLALHPVLWLVNTWTDPSYDSKGLWVFLCAVALFIWSITSKRVTIKPTNKKLALALLVIIALVRLAGQVFAVNVIGAVALVVDVYAIATLAGLQYRKRAVSPGWLAIIFAFSLPLERIIQRTIGYGLQHISADGACLILGSMFDNVACEGIRILLAGKDVLVDLPCSGARSTLLLLLLYSGLMATCRPSILNGILGFVLTLTSALIANIFRITILATGIAFPENFAGIDVMASPWHDVTGLIALGTGSIPVILWAQHSYRPLKKLHPVLDQILWSIPECLKRDGWWLESSKSKTNKTIPAAIGFLVCALVIVSLPRNPVDISHKADPVTLPSYIDNMLGMPIELSSKENVYFIQYGGSAAKMQYGDRSLMVVQTSAPLRHLHAPDECLRGLGFDVQYAGISHSVIPTAIYKATSSDNRQWRIAVSFMSEDGYITTNVSEAVWRWLQNPGQNWSAIQRISPWKMPEAESVSWDKAVTAALDISNTNSPTQLAHLQEGTNHD